MVLWLVFPYLILSFSFYQPLCTLAFWPSTPPTQRIFPDPMVSAPPFLMQLWRVVWEYGRLIPRLALPSTETQPSALVLIFPIISSFSGPDLDKLVVSFLRALWRAECCTLESLKTCHFHLELVADLTRQPGKWISVLKQRQNVSSDPAPLSDYGNCQTVVKVPFFPTPLIMLKTMSYCFWKS